MVVECQGELDLSTVPEVQEHLDAATLIAGAHVIVDLRAVQFLDATTLTLLCRARRRARERGGSMALVCANVSHLRVLQVAEPQMLFESASTIEEALGDDGAP